MKRIKLVIFDLDGTLIDSLGGLTFSINQVLFDSGYPQHSVNTVKSYVGNGIKNLVIRALPEEDRSETNINHHLSAMNRTYALHRDHGLRVYGGIAEILNYLTEQGIPMAVNTNKPVDVAREVVAHYLGDYRLNPVIGGGSFNSLKPNPEGALYIAEQYAVKPENCLYIGDSEVDVATARNAGMKFIAAGWGYRTRQQLLDVGAETLTEHPSALLELFNN